MDDVADTIDLLEQAAADNPEAFDGSELDALGVEGDDDYGPDDEDLDAVYAAAEDAEPVTEMLGEVSP